MNTEQRTKLEREVAVGDTTECPDCGQALVRTVDDFRERASGLEHACWTELPKDSEHLRLD